MSVASIELQTYERLLPSLLAEHDGHYVVIRGDSVEHFDPSFDAALQWAYDRFDTDRVFVKRVVADAGVVHFTRDSGPCRT